ncbi:MAG TPA: diadenylate cyclase [Thermoguttaceae bacterium]|nr:diadenylate cyclase [Thermoguttaceae bacterium]
MAKKKKTRRESLETRRLVETGFELAESLEITTLLVQADELRDVRLIEKLRGSQHIIWLSRTTDLAIVRRSTDVVVNVPESTLTRVSQMKIGLLLAVFNNQIGADESVLCLSGVAGSRRLDTLLIMNPRRDFPWFGKQRVADVRGLVATRELGRIMEIALRLAAEGREGTAIGTAFVLGDIEFLSPYVRQLVLNPCEGHPKKHRNIHDSGFFETLREFAALDGAFIVSNKGVVEAAGTYIDAPINKAKLSAGLGARHAAAAAITAETDATAVVVSASSGTVTVFHKGRAVLELEKPVPHPQQSKPARKKSAGRKSDPS